MLMKYFYDQALAHASYLVGCQRAGEAIIVDPGRDIEQYLEVAEREGVKLVAIAETHIHADYVSGARELAERVGAKLYVSDEGSEDWKYQFADQYEAQLLKHGDEFRIGKIKFETLHTPGHTPESISFLLTDEGGGADQPMGVFTGDFIFVGSIGRPDLLEEAAGVQGSAELGARDLFRSAEAFQGLPDYLQVWPAHGAGSACGKGLGAIPSTTVGYEKRFNPALQFPDEEAFVNYILADQPDAPKYFAVMKRVNKVGPAVLGESVLPKVLAVDSFPQYAKTATLLDLSPATDFAAAHSPGALNIPLGMLAAWAGWLVDYDRPVVLIAAEPQLAEAVRVLHKIGIDEILGVFDPTSLREAGLASESVPEDSPIALSQAIDDGRVRLFDVRSKGEWNSGQIKQAEHRFLGRLPEQLECLPGDRKIVVQCQGGARSAIAASLLQANGLQVVNMQGGLQAWQQAGLPICDATVESPSCQVPPATCQIGPR